MNIDENKIKETILNFLNETTIISYLDDTHVLHFTKLTNNGENIKMIDYKKEISDSLTKKIIDLKSE